MQETEGVMVRFRLPLHLKKWLAEKAKMNCRSMNGEMAFRLETARKSEEMTAGASTTT